MNLVCNKCKGKMFVDRVYTTNDHLEVFCIICGKRHMINPQTAGANVKWLVQAEKKFLKMANGL